MSVALFQLELGDRGSVIEECVNSIPHYDYDYHYITTRHPKSEKTGSLTYQYLWHLQDFLEYDYVIHLDTDVYGANPEPFPLPEYGIMTKGEPYKEMHQRWYYHGEELESISKRLFNDGREKYFLKPNTGIMIFTHEALRDLVTFTARNGVDEKDWIDVSDGTSMGTDENHLLKFYMEYPQHFNPTLPNEFHYDFHNRKSQDLKKCKYMHLIGNMDEKRDGLLRLYNEL